MFEFVKVGVERSTCERGLKSRKINPKRCFRCKMVGYLGICDELNTFDVELGTDAETVP